ncbi:GNAT family N-acetyltransferase [Cronbergia sp. UHCC 0137]|uniref:GNAT family N-acetyltransferase n=1 Tax=Cronbergia sp. UHCC 0137 TaxID=3110239 RepID=UPI002B205883|nr:GNAT family N-acetyltransferase [Cronbergia sp. UHCC 0137]MEA5616335.1 GNAT family N-acetyltransferase [Cronbergia sp. UHCC 0137]
MTSLLPRNLSSVVIRPLQYRDLDGIERLAQESFTDLSPQKSSFAMHQMQWLRHWYGLIKFFSWFPNPWKYRFCGYVAEQERKLLGMIQVSPFNRTRSTWRIDRVMLDCTADKQGIGSQLLRHCFESILEARTWVLEVNVNDMEALALYRQNGFQRLAEMTYWEISPELLAELARAEPDLPNLLPVSNADAQLLYQLDTASMPPLVRQVFDRHTHDFKTSLFGALTDGIKQWMTKTEVVSGYVFESQRKAAIGYFQVQLDRKGENPHVATLTVHPAYTWLYPELLSQLASIVQDFPQQGLQLASSDYQPEREAYLERIGAKRVEHTLIMSRSVWHKLRESKFVSLEGIQWTEVLQGLQPARKPIPGGMSWAKQRQQVKSEHPLPIKIESVSLNSQLDMSHSELIDPPQEKN